MRSRARLAAALALTGAVLGGAPPAGAASSAPTAAGSRTIVQHVPAQPTLRFLDPRIAESSGLAAATHQPDILFTHNDSGDIARFFAVDAATGRTLATYDLPGVTAVDWEDIATGPGPDGRPSVWLADIGDNGGSRSSVAVYVVREPVVHPVAAGRAQTAPVTATFRLRYPDGPHDAETLLVDPVRRRAFVVTKAETGRSGIYELPARPSRGAVATMARVGSMVFPLTGSGGGPLGPFGALTATGGSVAPDGKLLAIRTYTDVYVWQVGRGGIPAALRRPAGWRLTGPAQPQGEGVAFTADGRRMVESGEGVHSALYMARAPEPDAEAGATAIVSTSARSSDPSDGAPTLAIGLGVVAALAAAVVGIGLLMRVRRRRSA